MTNHWVDMVNADVVMIMGGNPAENHPIAMNWIRKTKERGAIVLQVDPRFNRTSHIADVWAKMRSGTDIAFVGGMINYALGHDRVQREYVRAYTTASFLVKDGFRFDPQALDRRFDRATLLDHPPRKLPRGFQIIGPRLRTKAGGLALIQVLQHARSRDL